MSDLQETLDTDLTYRQAEAWSRFFDPSVRELLYGGAKGGGKSYFLCVLLYTLSLMIIEQHRLEPSKAPLHWSWMGRKIGSDFVGTTLDTWQRVIPCDCYRLCGASDIHPRHILIWDRVAIDFGGLDSQQAINKFNSAEYAVVAVDQAEETSKDDVAVLMGSRRLTINGKPWLTINGKPMPFKGLWTANPAQCWLKEDFIDNPKRGHSFVRALPSDNPHLPKDYEEITLQLAFGHQPGLLRAYRYGDWDIMSGANQIIQSKWLADAKLQTIHSLTPKIHVSCDTARFGDDQTVIYAFDHHQLIDCDVQGRTTVPQVANSITSMCRRHGTVYATIESTGSDLGAGAIDVIRDSSPDIEITQYCPQGAPTTQPINPHTSKPMQVFGNMRAEAWDYTAKMLSEFCVPLPKDVDPELTSQLCWPQYKYKNGKTYVESKDDIKGRMLRSPDKADAFVMGIWGSQFARETGYINTSSKHRLGQLIKKYG